MVDKFAHVFVIIKEYLVDELLLCVFFLVGGAWVEMWVGGEDACDNVCSVLFA